jgi:hypothetical protein
MVGLIGSLRGSSYKIPNSLRFRSSGSSNLSRTPLIAGSQTTWTWSAWVKRGTLTSTQTYMNMFDWRSPLAGSGWNGGISFLSSNGSLVVGQGNVIWRATTAMFRDTSAWYHIVCIFDTTNATPSLRARLYVNGVLQTYSTETLINLNSTECELNSTVLHSLGLGNSSTDGLRSWFDGYMAEVNFIDGQALEPSSFGKINSSTGVWSPKRYTGTYGTNGFYLNFKDNSAATSAAIGKDYSGNYNNWTPNNISLIAGSSYDSMVDSPTLYGDSLQYFTGTRYPYNALNFRSSASTNLTRTPTVESSRTSWTWSSWLKIGLINIERQIFCAESGAGNYTVIQIDNGAIEVFNSISGTGSKFATAAIYNNQSIWYHVLLSIDTTQSLLSDRVKLYVNGTLQTWSITGSTAWTQNVNTWVNSKSIHLLGRCTLFAGGFFDGYMAETNLIDGQSLTPSSFGETVNGVWKPKTYSGTYGTNGFYLKFNDNSATTATSLGKDSAGSNNWTPVNFAVTDVTSTDITSVKLVNPNYGLQFKSSDSTRLSRTFGTPTAINTWTYSTWVKRRTVGTTQALITEQFTTVGNPYTFIGFADTNSIKAFWSLGAGNHTEIHTTATFADTSTWYHIMFVANGDGLTNEDKIKVYVNGVDQALTVTGANSFPTTTTHLISFNQKDSLITQASWYNYYEGYHGFFDGVMSEVNFVDGQALTPSSFGETIDGAWIPKLYTGTYGNNGFYLNFADRSAMTDTAIGNDASPNSNNWTPDGFVISDAIDYTAKTARGNYATLNPLIKSNTGGVFANANLRGGSTSVGGNTRFVGTQAVASGKWYWEAQVAGQAGIIKLPLLSIDSNASLGSASNEYGYRTDGLKANNGSTPAYGESFESSDIIGIALDLDVGTLTFYKNGVSQGVAYSSLLGEFYPGFGSGTGGGDVVPNFGQRPFTFTPPAGFKALNTYNLPAPAITNAASYMAAITYTGTGAALSVNNITNNKTFKPDLVWIKSRSAATDNALYDSVRGVQKDLVSNSTAAETTQTAGLLAFNDNGFNIGNFPKLNTNAATYVAWQWKAGDSVVTNTTGSITSQVNANSAAGFSVVTYTGTGTDNPTIGHGLNATPAMIFAKDRDPSTTNNEWWTYHKEAGADYYMILNTTADRKTISGTTDGGIGTSPSTTTFTIQKGSISSNNLNEVGDRYVAYCFAEVEGYSKFGSYTGNGSTDGPFVYCGFRPRWIMLKNIIETSGNWIIYDTSRDTHNLSKYKVGANTNLNENESLVTLGDSTMGIDILSNGFKIKTSSGPNHNTNSTRYIFAAFAETPFKYSLAR